jgi:hypothetical protein
MNAFLLLVIVVIHPVINHFYSKPKRNYLIGERRIE